MCSRQGDKRNGASWTPSPRAALLATPIVRSRLSSTHLMTRGAFVILPNAAIPHRASDSMLGFLYIYCFIHFPTLFVLRNDQIWLEHSRMCICFYVLLRSTLFLFIIDQQRQQPKKGGAHPIILSPKHKFFKSTSLRCYCCPHYCSSRTKDDDNRSICIAPSSSSTAHSSAMVRCVWI